VGSPIRLRSSLYDPSSNIGGACNALTGYTGLRVWGCSLREGNTNSGVDGLLYLKVVSGLGE
jgi:hypothetical protein